MPIEKDLSVSPWYDDYQSDKDYYRILHKPGVAVQTRELNQVQAMTQTQIERLGNNLFKRGTIIDGCSFSYINDYPYVKLLDNTLDSIPVDVSLYLNYYVKNSVNVHAQILDGVDGFESSAPDLKTLYLKYLNSGTDSSTKFNAGDILTVFDQQNSLFKININNGGVLFANTDSLVFTPAIAVEMSTGTFANGQTLLQTSTGANVYITEVDSTTLANSSLVLLKIRPHNADLVNAALTASRWTIANNAEIKNSTNTAVGTVKYIYGSGAAGRIITTSAGVVANVTVTNRGSGYAFVPHVSIKSANNTSGLSSLDLEAQNYIDKIKVSSIANATGSAYAFGVTEGVIYQKGYFLKVNEQKVVVAKYSNTPNNISVVFTTKESIVDSNIDTSLLDNSLGTENYTAPGADRLKLTPTLTVVNTDIAESNASVYILTSFSEGQPFRQNQYTSYDAIGDAMSQRTFDSSGNFVLDRFDITTRSPSNSSFEGNTITLVIDPGTAYVGGYKIQTKTNFTKDILKAVNTETNNLSFISLNYENYVRIKEVGGLFQYNTADTVDLYDTAKAYLSNPLLVEAGNTNPVGTKIGTARIRSLLLESGIQGTANAAYRLYMFDINMNTGKNFRDVKSIYYNGTTKGIADVLLEFDPTIGANVAVLVGKNDKLVFSAQVPTIRNANAINYTYRTLRSNVAVSNTGSATISLLASPNEFFPYTANLTDSQLRELYVVPTTQLTSVNTATGTVSVNTTSANVIGSGTAFLTEFKEGDYVYASANSTAYSTRKIISITNNTLMTLNANLSFANASATVARTFPVTVPVPFGSRTGLTANVDANGNVLTIRFNQNFTTLTSTDMVVGFNVLRSGVTEGTKQARRDIFVRLRLSNNAANTVGPWCLGIPDVFRLKKVYVGNSTVNTTTGTDITRYFYIDHNQNSNYYDHSFLYKDPKYSYTPANTDFLLVQFDAFETVSGGFFTPVSYVTANVAQVWQIDSKPLANLATNINTLEVPEFYTDSGEYYDLLNTFDFRPSVVNTAVLTTNAAAATINPAYTISFGNTSNISNDKKFPLPDSILASKLDYYVDRIVRVNLESTGEFKVTDVAKSSKSYSMSDLSSESSDTSLLIAKIKIPAYPTIPQNPSRQLLDILDKKIASENKTLKRINDKAVVSRLSNFVSSRSQSRRYTMGDIQKLENRIQKLEYEVSLSLLETQIKDRIVPSSIDPSVNRFKYGFFVDDFSTSTFSETSSPEYAASRFGFTNLTKEGNNIVTSNVSSDRNSLLFPVIELFPIIHGDKDVYYLNYKEHLLITQGLATRPFVNTTPNTQPNTQPNTDPRPPVDDGYVYTPIGDTAGAAIGDMGSPGDGGGAGDGGSAKILCTFYYKSGELSREMWHNDVYYGVHQADEYTHYGYLLWAKPLLSVLETNKYPRLNKFVFEYMVKPWSEEVTYRLTGKGKSTILSKIYWYVGQPTINIVGRVRSFFTKKSKQEIKDDLIRAIKQKG